MKNNNKPHTAKERYMYAAALFGENMLVNIISVALALYYTDVLFLAPAAIGVLMFVGRAFDAVTDPVMGMIVDRTRSRWGKCRPYLLFVPIPLLALTVLCFTNFGFSNPALVLAYSYVTYIIWTVAYTMGDIPLWSNMAVMTGNEKDRVKLISSARLFGGIGTVVPTLVFLPLVGLFATKSGLFPTSDSRGYFYAVLILAAIGVAIYMLAFFNSRERIAPPKEKKSIKDNLKAIAANKPFLRIIAAAILGSLKLMVTAAAIYYAKWGLGGGSEESSGGYMALLAGAFGVGMLLTMPFVSLLLKKFSNKQLYIAVNLFSAVVFGLLFFIGYNSLVITVVGLGLAGGGVGVSAVLQSTMIADTIDYMEWKSGQRTDGICFAGQTFSAKLSAGISLLISMVVLAVLGYNVADMSAVAALGGNIKEEFPTIIHGIYSLITIFPAIGCVLSVIPMFGYKLTGKVKAQMHSELAVIHSQAEGEPLAAEEAVSGIESNDNC